jgi:hypothetical protein
MRGPTRKYNRGDATEGLALLKHDLRAGERGHSFGRSGRMGAAVPTGHRYRGICVWDARLM